MSRLILALDIGTSSSRTALFTAAGKRLLPSTRQEQYPLVTAADGMAELRPQVLLRAIQRCLAGTLAHTREPVVAIGVSCFWHSLLGTDEAGRPLTNIMTWADSRGRGEVARLRERLSEREVHARTGCMLRASFWPAKLRWLRKAQPALFRRVRHWVSPAEWLQQQLGGGEVNCALGMATGTGLFDPTRQAWDPEMLRVCHLQQSQLGNLSDEPGETTARGFPKLRGAPWYPGIGDGAASNLGSGATQPGVAAINVGTSAALRILRRGAQARAPFGLFCYRVDAERYLVGGAISNAGNVRAWCLRELQGLDDRAVEKALAARPGPQGELTVLPFWNAERAPTWNEELRGAILGLNQHTSALDLLQAITEATYQRLASIAELVAAQEPRMPKFLVSGGIQHSAGSLQRLADALGSPIYANPEPEASLRGAAVLALERLGLPPKPVKWPAAIRPRRRLARLFAAARQRQEALEELLASAPLP